MSMKFRVQVTADIMPAIEAWRERFVSTVGEAKYRRAAGWAVDEVAKHAVVGIRSQFHKTLKRNTPWTQSAIKYERSTPGGLNAVEQGKADGVFDKVYVMPKQSVYLKYLFGLQDNTRLPGDVGLAQNHILIPWWQNITLTQGVVPTQYGGVPTGFLARLRREIDASKGKGSTKASSRWGVYFGEIMLHGQPRLAYIAQPPRDATSESMFISTGSKGTFRVGRRIMNVDRTRICYLLLRSSYRQPTGKF